MIYLQKYLLLFLRYSWVAVLIVALTMGLAWIRVDKEPNVYGSTAVLEVIVNDPQVLNIPGYQSDRINSLDAVYTVVESLTSNDVMLRVADAIKRTDQWAAGAPSGKVPPEKEASLAQSVRNQIRVNLKRGTRLIEVSAEDGDPKMAQQLAEQTIMQYLKLHDYDTGEDSKVVLESLEKQRKELLEKLNESTKKLEEFAAAKGIDVKKDLAASEQSDLLKAQLVAATGKRASIEASLAELKKVAPEDVEGLLGLPGVAALPEVAAIQTAIVDREAQFSALKERYLERHPKYIEAVRGLTDLRSRLKTALTNAGVTLQRQLDAAGAEVTRLNSMANEVSPKVTNSADLNEFQALQQAVNNDKLLHANVEKRISELNVTAAVEKAPFKYSSKALLNPSVLRPNKVKSMTDAGLLGLAIAVALILLIDRLDSTIRTVDDAEKQLGLPVLAAVPNGNVSNIPRGGTVMTDAAGSAQAEAFRTLRASLSLIGDESRRRTTLVTSAIPAEGKTFCSVNLAACLAGQGFRTLLVDADLRRPALSATLLPSADRKTEHYRGLTDVLSGNIQPLEAVRATAVTNLFLLPAGRRAPNPSELLAQATLPTILKYLEGHFDRIVFDTAPINAVSDTLGLSAHVQGVVIVLRFGKTPKRAVSRALQLLKKAGAKLSGVVMNRVPIRRGAAYYYYYYGDPYLKDSVYGSPGDKRKKKRKDLAKASEEQS